MAAVLVQSKQNNTSTLATTAATWDTPATAGNLLIIVVGADDYNATPPTGFTEQTGCGQERFLGLYLWFKVAAGGEASVNYVIGSAVTSVWATFEYSGTTASPYDISNGVNTDTGGATYATPTITPTSGGRLLIAAIGAADPGSLSVTLDGWTNSFTERSDQSSPAGTNRVSVGVADRSVTGDGVTTFDTTATFSDASIDGRNSIIIALKETAAGNLSVGVGTIGEPVIGGSIF